VAELIENQILDFLHRLRGYILPRVAVFMYGRLSECFRAGEIFGFEKIGTIGTAGTVGTGFFLGVFKAMEGLNPQVNWKIASNDPSRFYGI